MADKLNDLAGRMGKAPKGLGTGVKLLAAAAAGVYGLQQSMYTVDGGHRAIMFNRYESTMKVFFISYTSNHEDSYHFKSTSLFFTVFLLFSAKIRDIYFSE